MKKLVLFITLLLMTTMLAGCSGNGVSNAKEVNWISASYDVLDFKIDEDWQMEENDGYDVYYISEEDYFKIQGFSEASPADVDTEISLLTESVKSKGGIVQNTEEFSTASGINGKLLNYSFTEDGTKFTVRGFCFEKHERLYYLLINLTSPSKNQFNEFMEVLDSISINEKKLEAATKPKQGQAFNFDNFSITIGSELVWDAVSNRFSDQNGAEVVRVPITIVNVSDETDSLNTFYITLYGSQGTKLDSVTYYFKDALKAGESLRPEAEITKYLCFLYDGDGDYYVKFNNYSENIEIKIPIAK